MLSKILVSFCFLTSLLHLDLEIIYFLPIIGLALFYFKEKFFACCLPLAACFDPQLLLSIAALYLIVDYKKLNLSEAFYPILIVLFAWCAVDFFNLASFDNLEFSPPGWYQNIAILIPWVLLALIFSSKQFILSESFLKAFLGGLFFSQIITLFQILGIGHEYFPNFVEFWHKQNRYPGTFSDPNAFALFSFLAVVLVLGTKFENRKLLYVLIVIQFILAFFSGSRSYVLGIGLLALYWFFDQHKKKFILALAASIVLLVVHNLLAHSVPNYLSILPQSFNRIANSLLIDNLSQSIFSRFVFFKLNFLVFADYPWLGVGFNHFREIVPFYKSELGVDIQTWTDNTNSFYLGIFSELGVVGLIAFIFLFLNISVKQQISKIHLMGARVFLVLLLFGPHLNFSEVAIMVGILFANVYDFKTINISKIIYFVIFIALTAAIYLNSKNLPLGLYPEEKIGKEIYQWTTKEAQVLADCEQALKFRAANPDITSNPLNVKLGNKQMLVQDSQWKAIAISCDPDQKKKILEVEVSRTWQAKDLISGSQDQRELGIQLIH